MNNNVSEEPDELQPLWAPRDLIRSAQEALDSGRPVAARRLAQAAAKASPTSVGAWLILGLTAPSQEEADYCYQRAQRLIPQGEGEARILEALRARADRDRHSMRDSQSRSQVLQTPPISHEQERQESSVPERSTVSDYPHKSQSSPATRSSFSTIDATYPRLVPIGYLLALTTAEVLTTVFEPRIGLWFHAAILVALLLHGSLARLVQERRLLLSLSLAPLIRLLSLSSPLTGLPATVQYLVVGILLSVATVLAMRVSGLRGSRIGLTLRRWRPQVLLAPVGLGLGLVEYLILRPAPLIDKLTWKDAWMPALILLVFTGFLEEVVFRGLIQEASLERLGPFGLVYTALLFAVMHLGYRSELDVLFVFLVGLGFGLVVRRSGSLVGVSLAHGLTNVSLYVLIPFFL